MSQPANWDRDPDSSLRARYLEPPRPLVFPEFAEVPESQLHLDLRTLLYLLLSDRQTKRDERRKKRDVQRKLGSANSKRCLPSAIAVSEACGIIGREQTESRLPGVHRCSFLSPICNFLA